MLRFVESWIFYLRSTIRCVRVATIVTVMAGCQLVLCGSSYSYAGEANLKASRTARVLALAGSMGSALVQGDNKVSAAGYPLLASMAEIGPGISSAPDATASASANGMFYISPTGNDTSDGRSMGTAWLTPNHAVNCGDVLVAVASNSYSYRNFAPGKWGPVSCPSGNNVAWVQCITFDACKITVPQGVQEFGMGVSASYWGVQGWEVSNRGGLSNGLTCFNAGPANNNGTIHHIIFANNVANVCDLAGFGAGSVYNGTSSVDYFAVLGNISYGAATSNSGCGSGIGVYQPVASDRAPGTHIYIAGNLTYATTNPKNCWDGNGIILDTLDGHAVGMPSPYDQQIVVENNISISNAGVGIRVEYNDSGNGQNHAHVYVRHNTTWNNNIGSNQYGSANCGEFQLYKTQNTVLTSNLAVTGQAGCYGADWNPLSAYSVNTSDASNSVDKNMGWSAFGYFDQIISSVAFRFGGSNLFGANPLLANPTTPSAPDCSTFPSVLACMAPVVANFTPKSPSAAGFGYQAPSSTPIYDPFFPQWLCNVNLPNGLLTKGCSCVAPSAAPASGSTD